MPECPLELTTLTTDRLVLRPMRSSDAGPLLAVFGDPAVMAAFGRGPFTPSEMEAWVTRNLDHQARHGSGLFTVVLRDSGEVIGDCGLERMELDGVSETELGYDLRSDHWRRGLATEAASAVRDHARGALRIGRMVSLVRTGNDASARVAEKIGMVPEREVVSGGVRYRLYALTTPTGVRIATRNACAS